MSRNNRSQTENNGTVAVEESRIRAFCTGLPLACGVPEEVAEFEGVANGARFDYEVRNKDSVYRRRPGQSTRQRMKPAVVAWAELADPKSMAHGFDVLCYANDCYGFNKAGLPHPKELVETGIRLAAVEDSYPEIKALLPVAEAGVLSYWD